MDREEILSAAIKNKRNMDELQHHNYRKAYIIGSFASILLCVILQIYECITGGNWFGYVAIYTIQMGIVGLYFGLKNRETALGKLFIISGSICSISCVFNFVLFFIKG